MLYPRMQVAVSHSRPHCSRTDNTELKRVQPASSIMQELTYTHPHPHKHTPQGNHHRKPMQISWLTVDWIKRSNLDNCLIENPIKIKKTPAFTNCFTAHASGTNKSNMQSNQNKQPEHTKLDIQKNSSEQLYDKNPDFIKWTCVSVAVIPSMLLLHQEP